MYLPYLRQWNVLKDAITAMDSDSSALDLLCQIQSWLCLYPEVMQQELVSVYQLEKYADMLAHDYPIHTTWPGNDHFTAWRARFLQGEYRNWASIAQRLSSTLEGLVVQGTDILCPNCEGRELGWYFDQFEHTIAQECRQCGYARHADGTGPAAGALVFASQENLKQAGIMIAGR
ncbi:hypothetical protein ACO0LL_25945 [Undibacterium sp. TC4M20W]|uniref:hypothetical protein n=1 Tax=Undibacterium sp. TC4M20W TaxID=3413052 RepID=UPI003BF317F9